MEETLKSLRLIHQLVIIATATIIVFAVAPDRSAQYVDALDELSALRQVSFDDFPGYVHWLMREQEEQDNQFVRNVVRSANISVPTRPAPHFSMPLYCVPCGPAGNTLRDLESFLNQSQLVVGVKIERDEKATLRQIVAGLPWAQGVKLIGMEFYALETSLRGPYPDGTMLLPISPRLGQNHGRVDLILSQPGGTEPMRLSVKIPYYSAARQMGRYAIDWLRQQPTGQGLIETSPQIDRVFPKLKVFWKQLERMTPNEASRFLEEKLDSARGQLSFFGISVDTAIAAWVGPGTSLLLLLFFVAHVRHLSAVNEQCALLKTYPWIALFPDTLSKTLTSLSLLSLPVANVLLLVRSWSVHDWRAWPGIVFTAVVAFFSIRVLMEIRTITASQET